MSDNWKNNVDPRALGSRISEQWDTLVKAKAKVRDERQLLDMMIQEELGQGIGRIAWNDNYNKLNIAFGGAAKAKASAPVSGKEDLLEWLHEQRDSGRNV